MARVWLVNCMFWTQNVGRDLLYFCLEAQLSTGCLLPNQKFCLCPLGNNKVQVSWPSQLLLRRVGSKRWQQKRGGGGGVAEAGCLPYITNEAAL